MIYVILLVTILIMVLGSLVAKRVALRDLPSIRAMYRATGEALELGKTIHVSYGNAAILEDTAVSTIATSTVWHTLAVRSLLSDRPAIATLSDPITMSLSQDILRRAYRSRYQLARFSSAQVRWFPASKGSLALASGGALAADIQGAYTHVLTGQWGVELAIMAENALRRGQPVIAHSNRLDGQAVAYAISSAPLLGEELYAMAGYLDPNRATTASIIAQDVLRYAVIAALIILSILAFTGAAIQ